MNITPTPPTPSGNGNTPVRVPTGVNAPSVASGSSTPSAATVGAAILDALALADGESIQARVLARLPDAPGESKLPQQYLLALTGRTTPATTEAAGAGNLAGTLRVATQTTLPVQALIQILRRGSELQLQDMPPGSPPAAPLPPTLTRILAGVLPWQFRLDQGLNQLQQALPALVPTTVDTAQGAAPSATAVPDTPNIRQAQTLLNTFLQRLPDSTTLSQWARQADGGGTAIRQWLQNSGLFAEANLLRADTSATQADLKLVLNRILQPLLGLVSQGNDPLNALQRFKPMTSPELLLNPLQFPQPALLGHLPTAAPREELQVGDLLRLLAGMLNRITAQQLQSQLATPQTPNDPAPAQQWLLDLPWVDPRGETRVMQMRVERDDTEERDANGKRRVRQWRLQLALQLDGLGPVLFDLTLQAGALSTRIWAENAQALPRIQAALPELETHLHRLGLEVTRLECRQGHPSTPRTRLEHRLLDIRA